MRHLTTLLVAVFMLFGITTSAQDDDRVFHCIVAQDGTGDCTNIQDAVDKAPEQSSKPYLIYIKAGRYHEHVYIPAEKPFLHFIGEGAKLVRIFDDRVSGGKNASPVDVAATVVSHATDGYFEGITIENAWGTRHKAGPQALALYTKMDRTIVNHCALLSYQDTYRTANDLNARNYVKDCFIEGAVDFLYGQGNVFFDYCTLNIVRKQGGWIVAPKHDEGTTWGYVLKNTTITAPSNPSSTTVWLGRPWLHAPKVVFIDTKTEVTIPAEGWYDHMNGLPHTFADYNTTDVNGNPLDLSHRIDRYYKLTENKDTLWGTAKNRLTTDEERQYTVRNVLSGPDDWNPELLCRPLPIIKPVLKGKSIVWSAVEEARGYIIEKNGKVIGMTTQCRYAVSDKKGEYRVKPVSQNGAIIRE